MLKKLIPLFFSLFIAGCAVTPAAKAPLNQHLSLETRTNQAINLRSWKIDGLISIVTSDQELSANLRWQQHLQENYEINLFGPLNMGAVSIVGNVSGVVLKANNNVYQAKSAEGLLLQYMGWTLPVASLYYWVRGVASPDAFSVVQTDHFNHLIMLKQDGWEIDYLRYTSINNIDLPSKLVLKNQYMTAKLIISRWSLA